MTLPKLDFLFSEELAQIAADVAAMASDPELTVAVTYNRFISTVFTPETGTQVPTYTGLSLRAVRNTLTAREVVAGEGLYKVGDVLFTFDRATFAGAIPTREDRIMDGSTEFEVVKIDTDPIEKLWRIVARQVN